MSVSLASGALTDRPAEGVIRRLLRWLQEDECGVYTPCPCDAPGLPFAEAHPPGGASPQAR